MHKVTLSSDIDVSAFSAALNVAGTVCYSNGNGTWTVEVPDASASAADTLAADLATARKARLKVYAATTRLAKETGGITYQTKSIATDAVSQGKLGNAALAAQIVGASFSTNWKCTDGSYLALSNTQMITMATAIMNYVNSCYAAEKTIGAAIDGGTITTTAQVDSAAAWPSNSL